jgi:hypothetical protein
VKKHLSITEYNRQKEIEIQQKCPFTPQCTRKYKVKLEDEGFIARSQQWEVNKKQKIIMHRDYLE